MSTSEERYAEAAMAPVTELTSMWAVHLCGDHENAYGRGKPFMAMGRDATEAEAVALKSRPGMHLHPGKRTTWYGGLMPRQERALPLGWGYAADGVTWFRSLSTVPELIEALGQLPPHVEVIQVDGGMMQSSNLSAAYYYPDRNTLGLM